jgi:hypothetical protein
MSARNALLMNLFATPGLGTLMAGKVVSGLVQLALAVTGFALVLIWFIRVMIQYYQLAGGEDVSGNLHPGIAITGGIIFAVAWLWGFATGVQLWQSSRPDP